MARHGDVIKIFSERIAQITGETGELQSWIDKSNPATVFDQQQMLLNHVVHTSDVSNPARDFKIAKTWVWLLFDEFFH